VIFLESPIPILCIGIFVEAALGLILWRTGRGAILWAMAGTMLVVLGGVLLERMVVTERELVEQTIDEAAAALEANDEHRVFEYIVPSAIELRALVHTGLQRAEVTRAKITGLDIDINDLTSPPTAEVHVHGSLSFKDRHGESPFDSYPINQLSLNMRRDPQRWIITGYTWKDRP
jgi:hypothetical protein